MGIICYSADLCSLWRRMYSQDNQTKRQTNNLGMCYQQLRDDNWSVNSNVGCLLSRVIMHSSEDKSRSYTTDYRTSQASANQRLHDLPLHGPVLLGCLSA